MQALPVGRYLNLYRADVQHVDQIPIALGNSGTDVGDDTLRLSAVSSWSPEIKFTCDEVCDHHKVLERAVVARLCCL